MSRHSLPYPHFEASKSSIRRPMPELVFRVLRRLRREETEGGRTRRYKLLLRYGRRVFEMGSSKLARASLTHNRDFADCE